MGKRRWLLVAILGLGVTVLAAAALGLVLAGTGAWEELTRAPRPDDLGLAAGARRTPGRTATPAPASATTPPPPALVTLTVIKGGERTGTVSSTPAGINCGTSCAATFAVGATVTLTQVPDDGAWGFGRWPGCPSRGPALADQLSSTCLVAMDSTKTIGITFDLRPRIFVAKLGSGGGSVTSSPPGINCGSTCIGAFDPLVEVALTVEAAPGHYFRQARGAVCLGLGGGGTCTVSLAYTGDRNVELFFEPWPTLTVTKVGQGSGTVTATGGIVCGSLCSASYAPGTLITLRVVPSETSYVGVTGTSCLGVVPLPVAVNCGVAMGFEAKTVNVTFLPLPP